MNIALFFFVVLSILIILGGTINPIKGGKTVTGVIFFIGSILLLVFFGTRWFGPDGVSVFGGVSSGSTWPPVINTCPDYLTFYTRTKPDGTKQKTCIDRVGVANSSIMSVFPEDGDVNDDKYFFSIDNLPSDPAQQRMELCKRAMSYKLTWEGITNGESCYNPSTDSNNVIPSSDPSGDGCPSS
jgi:hypothetical protein